MYALDASLQRYQSQNRDSSAGRGSLCGPQSSVICTDEGFDFPTLKQVKAVYPEAKFDLNAGARSCSTAGPRLRIDYYRWCVPEIPWNRAAHNLEGFSDLLTGTLSRNPVVKNLEVSYRLFKGEGLRRYRSLGRKRWPGLGSGSGSRCSLGPRRGRR